MHFMPPRALGYSEYNKTCSKSQMKVGRQVYSNQCMPAVSLLLHSLDIQVGYERTGIPPPQIWKV